MSVPDLFVWRAANEYKQAAEVCEEHGIYWAAAINAALAIEIYLKSFLSEKERVPHFETMDQIFPKTEKGHDLKELYEKIEGSIKKLMLSESALLQKDFDLSSSIDKYKDVFYAARYSYERQARKSVDTGIIDLARHMSELVLCVAKKNEKDA